MCTRVTRVSMKLLLPTCHSPTWPHMESWKDPSLPAFHETWCNRMVQPHGATWASRWPSVQAAQDKVGGHHMAIRSDLTSDQFDPLELCKTRQMTWTIARLFELSLIQHVSDNSPNPVFINSWVRAMGSKLPPHDPRIVVHNSLHPSACYQYWGTGVSMGHINAGGWEQQTDPRKSVV